MVALRAWQRWRVLLALLVGLNLTFICQGHDHKGHYTALHLSFLGEPHNPDEHDEGRDEESIAEPVEDVAQAGRNSPSLAPGAHLGPLSFAGVAVTLLGLASLSAASPLPLIFAGARLRKSQTTPQPETPPPR